MGAALLAGLFGLWLLPQFFMLGVFLALGTALLCWIFICAPVQLRVGRVVNSTVKYPYGGTLVGNRDDMDTILYVTYIYKDTNGTYRVAMAPYEEGDAP
jgi:hypothetical protein